VRHRTGVVALTLALVFGLLGSATAYVYLDQQKRLAADPDLDLVPVVVATTDLTYATELRPEHLQIAYYPSAAVPEGSFADPDSLIAQTTKVFLTAREPVLATKLTSVGGGLSLRIPRTMRATSMDVNVVSGVSGFVLPGDRVDVVVIIDRYGKKKEAISRTILQDVEVLAAGQKTNHKGDNPVKVQAVTLLVDPEGAEKLALALHEGRLHLVLRNPGDHEIASIKSLTTSQILADKKTPTRTWKKPAVKRKPPEKRTVTVIKGIEVDEQEPPVEVVPENTKQAPGK
jgi:pilus assembly protein CpaB